MRILWLDTETDGLDLEFNSIVRLAGVFEIDREPIHEFDLKLRPAFPSHISDQALTVNRLSREEIMAYPPAREGHREFVRLVTEGGPWKVDKYDRQDKLTLGFKNGAFDNPRLRKLFERCNDSYFGSLFESAYLDLQHTMVEAVECGAAQRLENWRLQTWLAHWGIEHNAHDALSDIKGTQNLYWKLRTEIQKREHAVRSKTVKAA